MKYAFIRRHKQIWPIALQCQVLGVNRSDYYHSQANTANKADDPTHQEMLVWVEDIAKASDDTCGSRRMQKALNALGYPVSRNKARKLMKEANV